MSRMNQVLQIGDIQGDIHYYIEDYAYTYLKKQKGKEKTKYFLYGEKEEKDKQQKLLIYGIAEKPKMEQTYFKEYYPLGFLKIKNDETFWITLKGQEQKMTGFYVFYAPNQAMQEYLVDHREEEQTDKAEGQVKRQLVGESLPMKETLVPVRKVKKQKNHLELKNEKFLFPIGGIIIAGLILLVLASANGQKKIEVFRQVIARTMSGVKEEISEEDFIIEEKSVTGENVEEDEIGQPYEEINLTESVEETGKEAGSVGGNSLNQGGITGQSNVQKDAVDLQDYYEEYVVKDGDTLVAICKTKYGSIAKMEEICTINNIKNADYIAPGQKIYLP